MMSSPRSLSRPGQVEVGPSRLTRRRAQRGYSLVELTTTVTIVGILSTLATYSVRERVNEAHSVEAISTLGSVRRGLVARVESALGSAEALEIGGRVGGFGGPLGLPGILGKNDKSTGNGNGNGSNKDGGIDGDGNNGHGNNADGCDPDNPGNSGKNCGGETTEDSGSEASSDSGSNGNGSNKDGGIDGDGNNGHGNNEDGCDPDNPGNGGKNCGGESDDGGDTGEDGGDDGGGDTGEDGGGDDGGGDTGEDGGGDDGGGDTGEDGGGDDAGDDGGAGDGSGSGSTGSAGDMTSKLCGSAQPVPALFGSVAGKVYQSSADDWSAGGSASAGWQCLSLSVTGAQRYQYGYEVGAPTSGVPVGDLPSGVDEASQYTAWARGDLDGDGRTSWFIVQGAMVDGQLISGPGITMVDQNE